MNVDEKYTADTLSVRSTILATFLASCTAALFTLACWFVLKSTHLPAFGGSNVMRGLSTAGVVITLVVLGLLSFLWLRDRRRVVSPPRWRRYATYAVAYLAPAALIVATLAIPLAATKLYLDGVTVDQGFRTQYLTRLTESWQLHDMNYRDLPAYYPALWFWLGGRFGNLLGLAGWEAYQPWALVSMSALCCSLVPLWQRVTSSLPVAAAIALVDTAIFLVTSAEEPYSGIVALGTPLAAAVTVKAFRGSRSALVFLAIFLGLSAATYTVFTVIIALSVCAVAFVVALIEQRSIRPLLRLLAVGVGAIVIALISWGPYSWAILHGAPVGKATATHYLPAEGTVLPLPMLSPTLIGGLCLLGVVYLIFRFRNPEIRGLGVTTVVAYCWILGSMVVTLIGQTLLGFRVEIVVAMLLATAGILGLAEIHRAGFAAYLPRDTSAELRRSYNVRLSGVLVTLLTIAGIAYAQTIPVRNHTAIDLAYTDTDGNGVRADRFPADSTQYFRAIDAYIAEQGYSRDTVVLADSHSFLSFYPYWGFQALTSHYANPLGEFERRNAFLEDLAKRSTKDLSDPTKFNAALEASPWSPPQVFIFRGTLNDADAAWKYDLAEDIYPNNPNVRFRGIYFNPASFADWHKQQIGPFVVVVKPLT